MTEADELWSFVGRKADVSWVWVALDAESRRVVAVVVGERSEFTAECLGRGPPTADRGPPCSAPTARRRTERCDPTSGPPTGRGSGGPSAGGARFVRKTRSFSECLENHLGARWFVFHLYNSSRQPGHHPFVFSVSLCLCG